MSTGMFMKTLVEWSKTNNINPLHMLMIMYSESGVTPSAAARNKNGTIVAAGISQIQPSNFEALGWRGSAEEFIKLSDEQQLPFTFRYMRPYLEKGLTEAHHIYACNFLPARCVGNWKQDGYVLCGGRGQVEEGNEVLQWAYDANRVLDANRDGFITMSDLKDHLAKVCRGRAWDSRLSELTAALGTAAITWKRAQTELQSLGFYKGKIDGVPGPMTCAAVCALIEDG